MRAPLPPPARPPIRAPPPAPPPIMAAVRLPLPLRYRLTELVCTSYAPPFIVTESRASWRTAPPLKRPRGTAWTTLPEASAPLGNTTFSSTSTGVATLAWNWSPELLSLEPTAFARRTVMTVPAGTVTSFLPNQPDVLGGALLFDVSSDAGGFEHPIAMQPTMKSETRIAKRRCTNTSCLGKLDRSLMRCQAKGAEGVMMRVVEGNQKEKCGKAAYRKVSGFFHTRR